MKDKESKYSAGLQLGGTFAVHGSKLKKQDLTLLICHRKKPTNKKTEKYIISLAGTTTSYISSLYTTDVTGVYRIEYTGNYYHLSIQGDTATVSVV